MKKPILLLTFNRLDYIRETFEQIRIAKPPRLYVASDGPREYVEGEEKVVQSVRDYILSNIDWDCEVKTRFLDKNSGGCAYGVSGAVTWFFENEEDGIILEDDCVPSQSFFSFCEELLDRYKDNKKVWHITGDAPIDNVKIKESYYFAKIEHCWGWASWADRWKHFKLDLSEYNEDNIKKFSERKEVQEYWTTILARLKEHKIDSWAYTWTFCIVAHDGLCINPTKNLISNIGVNGVHYKDSENKDLNKELKEFTCIIHPQKVEFNKNAIDLIYTYKFGIPNKSPRNKKLSIITVCYNDPSLEKTCKSIVNQTWQDFEWIVIDGGSNEETQKLWDKYKYRIDKFVSEPDNGIYNAYNKGIGMATGDYIILMNSGDSFYSEYTIEQVYPMLNDNYELLYGLTNLCWPDNREQVLAHTQKLNRLWFIKHNINTQSIFIRKDLFDKYGLFNETYRIQGDKDKWLTFMKGGVQFKYIPIIIANYDMTGLSSATLTRHIVQDEEKCLLNKFYTKAEVDKENCVHILRVVRKETYSIFEKIFSVKNSCNKAHKIMTIMGIHIKIKRNRGK